METSLFFLYDSSNLESKIRPKKEFVFIKMCVIYKLNKQQCIKKQFVQKYYIINYKIYCIKNEFTTGISCDIMMSVNKNTYSKNKSGGNEHGKIPRGKKISQRIF